MKCREALTLLEDYQFGDLEGRPAEEVATHLRSCAACSSAFSALESERALYERYADAEESSLELSPRVWQEVKARITEASAGSKVDAGPGLSSVLRQFAGLVSMRRLVPASLLVVVLVCAALLTNHTYRQSRTRTSVASEDSLQKALSAIHRAEREYQEAIRILTLLAEERKGSLDPEFAKELDRKLRAIDQSIASTRKAHEARPNDPELALYMLSAYARKVELLQELVT